MKNLSFLRPTTRDDLPILKEVIDRTGLFPSELLDEMTDDFLGSRLKDEIWLTYDDNKPIGVAFCAPEQLTEGTWNLYLIAVHPDYQSRGYGAKIMSYVEKLLTERGVRLLLVETSGMKEFARTRAFYRRIGYEEEARIREFYNVGDDKVIFRKVLSSK